MTESQMQSVEQWAWICEYWMAIEWSRLAADDLFGAADAAVHAATAARMAWEAAQ